MKSEFSLMTNCYPRLTGSVFLGRKESPKLLTSRSNGADGIAVCLSDRAVVLVHAFGIQCRLTLRACLLYRLQQSSELSRHILLLRLPSIGYQIYMQMLCYDPVFFISNFSYMFHSNYVYSIFSHPISINFYIVCVIVQFHCVYFMMCYQRVFIFLFFF